MGSNHVDLLSLTVFILPANWLIALRIPDRLKTISFHALLPASSIFSRFQTACYLHFLFFYKLFLTLFHTNQGDWNQVTKEGHSCVWIKCVRGLNSVMLHCLVLKFSFYVYKGIERFVKVLSVNVVCMSSVHSLSPHIH